MGGPSWRVTQWQKQTFETTTPTGSM